MDQRLAEVEEASPRANPSGSLQQVAQVVHPACQRVAQLDAGRVRRIRDGHEGHFLAGGPQLEADFVGQESTQAETTECVRAPRLYSLDLAEQACGKVLKCGCGAQSREVLRGEQNR